MGELSHPPHQAGGLARWPNVPACYGWLALDRRGQWRLQDEIVRHPGLLAFLNQHYHGDSQGCWYVQNGPQRVFVALAYTPWVIRWQPEDGFITHTGLVTQPEALWLDDEGSLLARIPQGIALLDDRDLPRLLPQILNAHGHVASDAQLLAHIEGQPDTALFWQTHRLQHLQQSCVAMHFGFTQNPEAPQATD